MKTRSKTRYLAALTTSVVFHDDLVFTEPSDIHTTMQSPHLSVAIQDELNVLAVNHTWSLVSLPGGKVLIGCKWLFKIKRNYDGFIAMYKAKLVAKGFSQKHGLYFQDTFNHVVNAPTVRIVLTLALTHKWLVRQVDVNNAFLHGNLFQDVFMVQPPGFEKCDNSGKVLVCKLYKTLYGLKKEPRACFERLKIFLFRTL